MAMNKNNNGKIFLGLALVAGIGAYFAFDKKTPDVALLPDPEILPQANIPTPAQHIPSTPVNAVPPANGFKFKIGDTLIVNNPIGATASVYRNNFGVYIYDQATEKLQYKEQAGKIVKLYRENGTNKPMYLVDHNQIFQDDFLLVKESDVKFQY